MNEETVKPGSAAAHGRELWPSQITSTRVTGGPAFPCETPDEYFSGMTLRDYFAAKAMQALLSNPNVVVADSQRGWSLCNCNMHGIALEAFTQADAMLKERAK